MKTRICLTTFFLFLFSLTTTAQDLVGRKIVNANLFLKATFNSGERV